MPLLEMEQVDKDFSSAGGTVQVLHGLNVTLGEGEFLTVTGPSGSGKTTFLHLAALLDSPTRGRVAFDGEDVSGRDEAFLSRLRGEKIGMVFQKYCLLPHRSVADNVRFRFRYFPLPEDEIDRRVGEALETVGLTPLAERKARLLSGGEMQRVAIARAIALRPKLLIADEPTGNLDGKAGEAVMEYFRELNETGMTILMVTHNETLLRHCTRHLVCQNGVMKEERA